MTIKGALLKGCVALAIFAIAVLVYRKYGDYLSIASVKQYAEVMRTYCQAHLWESLLLFFLISLLWVGLAIPGAAVFPIIGGILFDIWIGGIVSTVSMAIGCVMAFLLARFVIGKWLQERFAERLQKINRGIEKEGVLYLIIIRYMPITPFFLINLLSGLTTIPARTFLIATGLTILPGNLLFAYIGSVVAQWEKISDILVPEFIAAMVLFSVFPLITKKIINAIRARRAAGKNQL